MKRKAPIKRSKFSPRGKPIARHVKPKAVNPKRKAKRFIRSYGGQERRKWIESLPCTIPHCGAWPSVNSHVGDIASDKGAGLKASARYVIPMCIAHEREYHHGSQTFAARYGLDLSVEVARVEQCWNQLQEDGLAD